jgi:hypothetical protein
MTALIAAMAQIKSGMSSEMGMYASQAGPVHLATIALKPR